MKYSCKKIDHTYLANCLSTKVQEQFSVERWSFPHMVSKQLDIQMQKTTTKDLDYYFITYLKIHISLAVSYTGLLLPSFQIPYICVSVLYWCFSFWLTSLCIIGSSFIHLINWFKCILFHGWVILHCVYVPQLSCLFICWWASRLFPYPGYYKQCCDEHWGTCVSFDSGFFGVYVQQWDWWVIRQFNVQFFKESPHCSP